MVARISLAMMILFPLASQADLVIDNAWIKNLPPTVPVRAAYMDISNTGQEEVCIVSFSSEKFSNIALPAVTTQLSCTTSFTDMLSIEPSPTDV